MKRSKIKLITVISLCITVIIITLKKKSADSQNDLFLENENIEKLMKEAGIENYNRIIHVRQICKKYKMGSFKVENDENEFKEPPTPQFSILYIDSKHNISYCPIYKSGSTTWIYNLCLLNGVTEDELSSTKEQISTIARRIMPELDDLEAIELLMKTMKLLVVRHPFERLLSAYRDKLENSVAGQEHGTLYFYKKYGRIIVRKYRDKSRPLPTRDQVIRLLGLPGPAGTEPTWREFVEYLIDTNLPNYSDDHWIPYNFYCTPCMIDYDFIGKVETFGRDQAYIIHRMGLTEKIRPRWKHKLGITDAAAIYFSQLTKEHVYKLYNKYKVDFELFGYSPERYYQLATSIN